MLAAPATRNPLLSSSTFMAVFTTLKHYIQPIMVVYGASMLARLYPNPNPGLTLTRTMLARWEVDR